MKKLTITFDIDKESYRDSILCLLQYCAMNPPHEDSLSHSDLISYYAALNLLFSSLQQTF